MRRRNALAGALSLWVLLLGLVSMPTASSAPADGAPAWIVVVADGQDVEEVAGDHSVVIDQLYELVLNGFTAELTSDQMRALRQDERVDSVSIDRVFSHQQVFSAQRTGRPEPVNQILSWGDERAGLLDSRTAKVDNRDKDLDVDIAIFDSGIDPTHFELRVAGGVDCAGAGTWEPVDPHGTLVAGVAAAIDNRTGVVGIAPGARVWSVAVERTNGGIFESALLCGLEWVAARGDIEVINMSLGLKAFVTGPCGVKETDAAGRHRVKDALHSGICVVHEAGVVVVAAAGNDSYDAERQLPAAYPEVISVSANGETDGLPGGLGPLPTCLDVPDDHLAFFSNFGATIDFTAVGVCVPTTFPGGKYLNVNGTSFSAPSVAGAAALVLARQPELTPDQVKQLLLDVAEYAPLFGDPDGIAEPRIHVGQL